MAKKALNNLRKYNLAGRIIETKEGIATTVACDWCKRPGNKVDCKIFKDRNKVCAYYKRYTRSRCSTLAIEKEDEDRVKRRVTTTSKLRVAKLEA